MMKPKKKPKPPAGLSAEAKQFWAKVCEEYDIDDVAGLKLLERACEAIDRMRRAQVFLKKDGEVIRDRKGSVKAHPACAVERDAHRQFCEALKLLNLDLEPLRDQSGRPPGK